MAAVNASPALPGSTVQEFLDKHHISVHPVSIVEEATSIGKFLQEVSLVMHVALLVQSISCPLPSWWTRRVLRETLQFHHRQEQACLTAV